MVGVGAVVFFGDAAILVRRNNEPGKGRWSLPGGLVELGESLEEALRREIVEELSVDVAVKGLLDIFERVIRDPEERVLYHYIVIDYWAEVVSGSPEAGSDAGDIMMVSGDLLETCQISREVRAALRKAFGLREVRPWLRE
jgi:ADP-ribose pyrophosphatase YjhB (NUDIX family)